MHRFWLLIALPIVFAGCKKDEEVTQTDPRLVFTMHFDENQARLDNLGNPSSIPAGNAAQTPKSPLMAANYIELTPTALTAVGDGEVVYRSPTTTQGGANAIAFDQLGIHADGETFASINLKDVKPGTYRYLRISLAYQKGNLDFSIPGTIVGTINGTGELQSFLGFNSYLTTVSSNGQTKEVNGNRLQGFWAFYASIQPYYTNLDTGQSAGTTVVNPIAGTSPIPAGSCIVTGEFNPPLVITGSEDKDVKVKASFSINNSFEWNDPNGNDIWEPTLGEDPVDMGVRGLVPSVE